MKAEMSATGTLVLIPETGAEAYALMHWVAAAQQPKEEGKPHAVRIDLSLFPETIPPIGATEAERWAKDWQDAHQTSPIY